MKRIIISLLSLATIASYANQQEMFGSIAISLSTAHYGYSIDQASQGEAESVAMNACEIQSNYAGDCQALIWFKGDTCGAIAVNSEGDFGAGYGPGHDGARKAALDLCHREGPNCQVIKSMCN